MTQPPHHKHGFPVSSWKDAFGVTPKQAKTLIALMSAQLLDYDGATTAEMRAIGLTPTETRSVSILQHLGFVELVGHVGKGVAVYRASTKAFRCFGVTLPRPIPSVIQTAAGRAEMIAERAKRRRHEQGWRVAGGEVG